MHSWSLLQLPAPITLFFSRAFARQAMPKISSSGKKRTAGEEPAGDKPAKQSKRAKAKAKAKAKERAKGKA